MAEKGYLDRLRSYLGLEDKPEEPKKPTPSEQQAIDKAIPRRFESTVKKTGRNDMPSLSQRQQKFMGAELARKRAGEKTQTGMSEEQLRDFASTPRKGLPETKAHVPRRKRQ